jgi:ABC-type lipoprotein export system ATPase subunit
MFLIELSNYTLPPVGSGHGIRNFAFSVTTGDVCAVDAQNPDDAHQFLRALATLVYPSNGCFRFNGEPLSLKNYKELLNFKKKVAYIAPDAALISNLTVKQNILLHRYYFENDLAIDLDDKLLTLCDTFGITRKLDSRPVDLNSAERQTAIAVREISKAPVLLLLDHPEDFAAHTRLDLLSQLFTTWIDQRKPVVFVSYDRRLIRRFANRKIQIVQDALTTVSIKTGTYHRQTAGKATQE